MDTFLHQQVFPQNCAGSTKASKEKALEVSLGTAWECRATRRLISVRRAGRMGGLGSVISGAYVGGGWGEGVFSEQCSCC